LTKGASKAIIIQTGVRSGLTREIVHVLPTRRSVVVQVHGHTSDSNYHFVKGVGDGKYEKKIAGVVFQRCHHIFADMLYDAKHVSVYGTGSRSD
jgi:hypothetical protein